MGKEELEKLNEVFDKYPSLKLVYLFGSRATGKTGPLSDYDFALYIDEKDRSKAYSVSFQISADISMVLRTDNIDIVIINHTDAPELKYSIVAEGKLIFEREPYQLLIEPHIISEYFDFRAMLRRHHLTRT